MKNNKLIIIIIGIIVIIAAILIYQASTNKDSNDMMKDTTEDMMKDTTEDMMKDTTEDMMKDTTEDMMKDTTEGMMEDNSEDMMANSFKLMSVTGDTVSLSDLEGKPTYIKFWASWCSICLAGLEDIDNLSGQMNDFNVITIVSPDFNGEQSESDFINWFNTLDYKNMTVLLDPDGTVAKAYGVRAYPTSSYLDASGNVLKTLPGHVDNEAIAEFFEMH